MPKKAASHIQKSAPGPPSLIAVATPTMLPVPTVAASAVQSALNESMSPSPLFLAKNMSFRALGSLTTCSSVSRNVSQMPVPTSKTKSHGPQTMLSIWFKMSNNIDFSSHFPQIPHPFGGIHYLRKTFLSQNPLKNRRL